MDVKKNFFIEELIGENMSQKIGETSDVNEFISWYYDGVDSYDFIFIGNMEDYEDDDYTQLYLSGKIKGSFTSLEEYIAYIKTVDTDNDSYSLEVRDDGHVTINGSEYRKISKIINVFESNEKYIEEYYVLEKHNIYFQIYLFYTSGSERANTDSQEMLNGVFIE